MGPRDTKQQSSKVKVKSNLKAFIDSRMIDKTWRPAVYSFPGFWNNLSKLKQNNIKQFQFLRLCTQEYLNHHNVNNPKENGTHFLGSGSSGSWKSLNLLTTAAGGRIKATKDLWPPDKRDSAQDSGLIFYLICVHVLILCLARYLIIFFFNHE